MFSSSSSSSSVLLSISIYLSLYPSISDICYRSLFRDCKKQKQPRAVWDTKKSRLHVRVLRTRLSLFRYTTVYGGAPRLNFYTYCTYVNNKMQCYFIFCSTWNTALNTDVPLLSIFVWTPHLLNFRPPPFFFLQTLSLWYFLLLPFTLFVPLVTTAQPLLFHARKGEKIGEVQQQQTQKGRKSFVSRGGQKCLACDFQLAASCTRICASSSLLRAIGK